MAKQPTSRSDKSPTSLTLSEEKANSAVSRWWNERPSVEDHGLEPLKAVTNWWERETSSNRGIELMEAAVTAHMKMPKSRGVAEARKELPKLLKEVDQGETFIIRGPKGRETLMIDADAFRSLQGAYFALLGELETRNILENEEAKKSLDAALESDDYVDLSDEDLDT